MSAVQTSKMSNFRWVICALLFLATTINYMDRQVLSLTWKDFIAPDFHWTDGDYGTITGMFSLFYAVANLFAGKFIDWMGTKKGYLIAIFVSSSRARGLSFSVFCPDSAEADSTAGSGILIMIMSSLPSTGPSSFSLR